MPGEGENDPPHENPPPADGINSNLPLPDKFHGSTGPKQTELWLKWYRRFERYRHASGLVTKPDRDQVSTLLYAMGDCADDILITLSINEETISYADLTTAFNNYYKVRKNIVADRAKFNNRKQQPGEPLDVFIQEPQRA